jgi:4-amino-4-deoxy-L-arabinose transferase-like glycosyltransferase
VLKKIVIAGLLIYTIFYLFNSFIIITYPYQISYPEGFILNHIQSIIKGESIYRSINDYPLTVVNYPPVYLYLCAGLTKLTGLSFFGGRLITFLASIFVVLLIFEITRRESDKEAAFISALLFIASPYIYKNSPLMRVDMLGLLFSLLGMYIFIKTDTVKNTFYSIPLFILSLYTKPVYFSAPVCAGIWLMSRDKKRGVIFILLLIISYGIIFFILNYLTKGEFFRHTFLYNLNIFIPLQAIKHYVLFFQFHSILIIFSVFFIFDSFVKRRLSIFLLYFIISAFTAFSVGKIGANTNYFIELIAISCILTGSCINKIKEYDQEKIYNLLLYASLFVQLILFLHIPSFTKPSPSKMDIENFKKLSSIISKTEGPIISEDGGILVLNKKEVIFMPFEFTQLANQKIWNQDKFLKDIKNKRFSLLLLSFDIHYFFDRERLTPEMIENIKENYYIDNKIGDYFIYKPVLGK